VLTLAVQTRGLPPGPRAASSLADASSEAALVAMTELSSGLSGLDDWLDGGAAIPATERPAAEARPRRAPLPVVRYLVQPGDSLASIAQAFDLDVPTLLTANEIDDPDLLPVGMDIRLPAQKGVVYRVEPGDTLQRIARLFDLPAREIARANGLADAEYIVIGEELMLPGARPLPPPPPSALPTSLDPEPAVAESAPGASGAAAVSARLDVSAGARAGAALLRLSWPAGGPITTYFGDVGWTSPRGHSGLDIAAPYGSPVGAAAAGRVVLATRYGGPYGTEVIIDHGGGLRTIYGHLSRLDVETGDRVERGEVVGLVGSTGFSTGPHLHFEVRVNGELRNPLGFLP
jgi:murein DD-endopeptidase MepM/ murein hydrolase activator NlpD